MPQLQLGNDPTPYVTAMWVLFALFVARVVGQILAATIRPRWLPAMARWYSGVMPYRYLLPAQLIISALMVVMIVSVSWEVGHLGARNPSLGVVALWASYVYAAGMFWRAVRRMAQLPERRGVIIPIVFHAVLAGFLFMYGSWHVGGAKAGRPLARGRWNAEVTRDLSSRGPLRSRA
jgi:hypothetical protein